jgi:hypothetical protein
MCGPGIRGHTVPSAREDFQLLLLQNADPRLNKKKRSVFIGLKYYMVPLVFYLGFCMLSQFI